jgi:hypothetical protein
MLQVQHGAFRRVHPTKPGTFDCNPSNLLTLRADLEGSA